MLKDSDSWSLNLLIRELNEWGFGGEEKRQRAAGKYFLSQTEFSVLIAKNMLFYRSMKRGI